jgi:hypothetical protein
MPAGTSGNHAFLLSDEASNITGTQYATDGDYTNY